MLRSTLLHLVWSTSVDGRLISFSVSLPILGNSLEGCVQDEKKESKNSVWGVDTRAAISLPLRLAGSRDFLFVLGGVLCGRGLSSLLGVRTRRDSGLLQLGASPRVLYLVFRLRSFPCIGTPGVAPECDTN